MPPPGHTFDAEPAKVPHPAGRTRAFASKRAALRLNGTGRRWLTGPIAASRRKFLCRQKSAPA